MENEAKVTVETSEKRGRGSTPTRKRTSWVVPTDTLVGDGLAKVTYGRDVKHGVGYGEYSTGAWVSVTLTHNQDDETMRHAMATAKRIAEAVITKEDARLAEKVERVAEELNGNK